MEDDWEALAEEENVVIAPKIPQNINKWEGEDEDDDVKESWEDEEEKKDEEKVEVQQPTPSNTKLKKGLQTKLNDKERKQLELEEQQELERIANMTSEEKLAEKLRLQQIEKESDLKNALDTFGISEPLSGLDAMHPTTKLEFNEFGQALSSKISLYKNDEEYPGFVEELVRSICANLSSADIKKVKITVDSLHLEKQKMEKEKTKKPAAKGKSKIKLRVESENVKSNNANDYGEGFDDYDDFM